MDEKLLTAEELRMLLRSQLTELQRYFDVMHYGNSDDLIEEDYHFISGKLQRMGTFNAHLRDARARRSGKPRSNHVEDSHLPNGGQSGVDPTALAG